MMLNLVVLVQLGMSAAFINKFPHLIEHLKGSDGYNADIPFRLDNEASEWVRCNITVAKEILSYGEQEKQNNDNVIKLF